MFCFETAIKVRENEHLSSLQQLFMLLTMLKLGSVDLFVSIHVDYSESGCRTPQPGAHNVVEHAWC